MDTFDKWTLGLAAIGFALLIFKRDETELSDDLCHVELENIPCPLPTTPVKTDEQRVMIYADLIRQAGAIRQIDPSVIASLIQTESSGIADQRTPEINVNDISYGLMQVRTETAKWLQTVDPSLGYSGDPEQLKNPAFNVKIGTYYLKWQHDRYYKQGFTYPKLMYLTIGAYNSGSVDFDYYNKKKVLRNQNYVDTVLRKVPRYIYLFQKRWADYKQAFPPNAWGFRTAMAELQARMGKG